MHQPMSSIELAEALAGLPVEQASELIRADVEATLWQIRHGTPVLGPGHRDYPLAHP